jgi:hypothetical protein
MADVVRIRLRIQGDIGLPRIVDTAVADHDTDKLRKLLGFPGYPHDLAMTLLWKAESRGLHGIIIALR